MADAVTPIVRLFDSWMGGTSGGGSLSIVVSVRPTGVPDGGEAFRSSILMNYHVPPSAEQGQQATYILAHEVFHRWNPGGMQFVARPELEWFTEGFSVYFAQLASVTRACGVRPICFPALRGSTIVT